VRILIANDDGVYSPGLVLLAEVAARFGQVRIVVPEHEQSSMGHAVTSSRPLDYRRVTLGHFEAYRVNGTPADCVSIGIHNWAGVDVVLSGVNLGHNLGNSTWHSGTLAAAKQAALFGVRGVALSAQALESLDEAALIRPFVELALKAVFGAQPAPQLVNVNFPAVPRGLKWTRLSIRHYDGRVVLARDPMGREHYWFTPVPVEQVEPDTDRAAIEAGLVSMTPLRLDLTDHAMLAELTAAPAPR
jgi:5'-nucleotidase